MIFWARDRAHMSGYVVIFVWLAIIFNGVMSLSAFRGGARVDAPMAPASALDVTTGIAAALLTIGMFLTFLGLKEGGLGAVAFGLATVIGLILEMATGTATAASLDDLAGAGIGAAIVSILIAAYVVIMGGDSMTGFLTWRRVLIFIGAPAALLVVLSVVFAFVG
ncbi:MAG: hypothetical protein LBK95_16075 [Bifidobacteriaceae bacterium]|jgi:hypothetical protein|nr:hypothetical protein [Bifidobacteriaceae bacterium]